MKRNKKQEPLWCRMYRKEYLTPQRQTEQKGRTAASQAGFYNTKAWKQIRDQRRRANPLCQHCEANDMVRPMAVVDHILPVDEAPELMLSIDNTQSLCNFHDDLKTKADAREKKHREKLHKGKLLMQQMESKETPGG